uniref:NB-ARC domain-containing protein n=1 Tax=Aegilops tauschii TaxID=37682 RepID=M8B0Z4_AEGTA
MTDHERLSGRILVVIDFVSDVDEDEWTTFHHFVMNMDRRSKVIILGRSAGLEKFGTIKHVSLDSLVLDEYMYLFKTLAFGSTDPADYPRLAAMVEEFAMVLGGSLIWLYRLKGVKNSVKKNISCLAPIYSCFSAQTLAFGSTNPADYPRLAAMVEEFAMVLGGSFIIANVLADALRKNLSAHFWLYRLKGARDSVNKNISCFSAHPQVLFSQGQPVHLIGRYILTPAAPSGIVNSAIGMGNVPKEQGLPRTMFGDLIAAAGHAVLPEGDFRLISWESRLPPYTSFSHLVHAVLSCVHDKPETSLSGKKRPGLFA